MVKSSLRASLVLLAALSFGGVGGGARASAQVPSDFAITPGNDALIGSMLGTGSPLPAACELDTAQVERTRIVARYRCGDATPELELRHPSDPVSDARALSTARFSLAFRGEPPTELVVEVIRRIRAHEADFRWTRVAVPPAAARVAERVDARAGEVPRGRRAELVVAYLLFALSVPALVLAYRRAKRTFVGHGDASALSLALAVTLGIVARLVAPLVLVTMYIGYLLTEQAIELQFDSHYGLASQLVPHLVLSAFPHDHETLMRANSVAGMLSIPLVATLAARLGADRRTGVVAALLVSLVPLFVKNDASEANNVVTLLALFGGLVLFDAFVESGSRVELAFATVLLAFATVSRPEMPLVTPAFVLGVFAFAPSTRRAEVLRDRGVWLAVALGVVLVAPHVLHVASAGRDLASSNGLSTADGAGGSGIVRAFLRGAVEKNTVLTPSLFPLALPLLALAAVLHPDPRVARPRAVLLGACVYVLGVYGLDLCTANMARVHVPAALLATLLAAMGFVRIVELGTSKAARGIVAVALTLAIAASAVPTATRLYAPTNEAAEESFIRDSFARLPRRERFTLVRFGSVDADAGDRTHRHFPDYLVRVPVRNGRTASIADFVAEPDFGAPAYFYGGTRCYAQFRAEGSRAPHGSNLQRACAVMRERFRLEPVIERAIVNRGDVWLEYYGDAPRLVLGLYRIHPR